MRLLVFNCHEAWVHMLSGLDAALDIVVGLPGHHTAGWDARMRPLPAGARSLTLPEVMTEAIEGSGPYDCILCHNLTDLMDCKDLIAPRLLVVHSTYEGRKAGEKAEVPLDQLRAAIQKYLGMLGGHAIAVSALKTQPGNWPHDVVTAGVDPADYRPYRGETAAGIRVVNQIEQKRELLRWDLHEAAFGDLPVTLVGHNPELPGVAPAESWDALKVLLQEHRFYIHTADPRYEDGFNMAMLEAMATGLPVIGNRHPSSPIEHGVSGFLGDTPDELRGHAERLLADRDLAARMGAAARETVARRFPQTAFHYGVRKAIQKAQRNWRRTLRRTAA